jgi:hypothetical protein
VSPVKYELGFYIPGDDILHSHCRENLKSYILRSQSGKEKSVSPRCFILDILHQNCPREYLPPLGFPWSSLVKVR